MTKDIGFSKAIFGEKVPFMSEDQSICGIGLGLLLLWAVQLFQCSWGNQPDLYIQAHHSSEYYDYIETIGFSACNEDERVEWVSSTDPCIIIQRNDANSKILHASTIVNPI